MPSPAQNDLQSVVHTGKVTYWGAWYPPEYRPTINLPIVQKSQALQCPATVVNKPVHGIRKMSAWDKRWFRCHCAPQDYELSQTGNFWYKYKATVPVNLAPSSDHTGTYWDLVSRWWPWTPSLEFSADNEARTKTLGKLSQKKWDVGVSAVELRQTAGLVTQLATGMAKTVENLINSRHNARQQVDSFFKKVRKHGSFDQAAREVGMSDTRLLESLKDGWMQYQFGVRPLLGDIDNATSYLADKVAQKVPFIVYAKAGAERTDTYMGTRNCSSDSLALITIRPRIEESCQVHYSVAYEIPTGQVSELTSLGLDNPWNVAWETTLLSWMADYVVGTGDWLQSFTATNGMVFREGCRSVLRKLTASEWIISEGNSSGVVVDRAPKLNRIFLERSGGR